MFLDCSSKQLDLYRFIDCNLCFITRLLVSPVLIIFEGLCLELSAGCSNCTVAVPGVSDGWTPLLHKVSGKPSFHIDRRESPDFS